MGGPGFEAIDGLDGIDGIEGIEPMDAKAPAGSATAVLTSTASATRPFNGRFLTTTPFFLDQYTEARCTHLTHVVPAWADRKALYALTHRELFIRTREPAVLAQQLARKQAPTSA
jgi:hypothetical protein